MFMMQDKGVTVNEIEKAIHDEIKAKERQEKEESKKKAKGSPRSLQKSKIVKKDVKNQVNKNKNAVNKNNYKELPKKDNKLSNVLKIDNKVIDLGDIEIIDVDNKNIKPKVK